MDTNSFYIAVSFVIGATLAGGLAALLYWRAVRQRSRALAEAQKVHEQQQQALVESFRREFAALSREALSANTEDFLKIARSTFDQQTAQGKEVLEARAEQMGQTFEEKRKLIDTRLSEVGDKLQTLNGLLQAIDKQRAESHASLRNELERATSATNRLHETTAHLREALANPQRRGQWGERMAEDVLRLAGFLPGVNYVKQQTAGTGGRPDYTFPLPGGKRVHMDVKFPLANYLKMMDAADEGGRNGCRAAFLKDVRMRIREVTTREYIDSAGGTVDYVLVFIPNEQIYGFVHECDATLLDEAMKARVVLCSPLTLYAVLSVMRQAMENFRLEQSSRQVLELLSEFKKQWFKYVESMDKMGRKLDEAVEEYAELTGVRTRQLDRQLDKVEALREATGQSLPGELPFEAKRG